MEVQAGCTVILLPPFPPDRWSPPTLLFVTLSDEGNSQLPLAVTDARRCGPQLTSTDPPSSLDTA